MFLEYILNNVSDAIANVAELSLFNTHPYFSQIYHNHAILGFHCVIENHGNFYQVMKVSEI